MKRRSHFAWNRWATLVAGAAALALAACGGSGAAIGTPIDDIEQVAYKHYTSNLNPSNVVIIETDLALVTMQTQPAAHQIQAAAAHQMVTGQGIVVAVLDGGFALDAPLLRDRLFPAAFDAVDMDDDPTDLGNGYDDDGDGIADNAVGHGTFVAGMVLLAAPDAMILPVRVVDDEGFGTNEQLAQGLEFALAMGVDVINLSLEASKKNFVKHLLTDARAMGVVVVASAGNSGGDLGGVAEHDDTIAVGAVDGADVMSEFTNEPGQKREVLNVCAPGVDLIGPLGAPDQQSMGTWSGTSFSAGIVSGAVALYLQVNPGADPEMVTAAIAAAVDPAFDADGIPQPFPGRINLARVVVP